MRCKITGIKTKVRYKGRPISAKFLETAIKMVKDDQAADVSHALEIMEKGWHKQMMEAKVTAQKSHSAIKSAAGQDNETTKA